MGWQDREYAKGVGAPSAAWQSAQRRITQRYGIVKILLAANIAVYVLCSISSGRHGLLDSPIFQFAALYTPAVLHGEIWRLLTANYLHWSFGHIFMNMLGLFFLGQPLERDWGAKRFFVMYTIAGVLGSGFYVGLSWLGWLSINGIAAGASGSVLGLLGAAAVRYPHAKVLIYFIIPIKIRTAAMVFGAWYLFNLLQRGSNAGGDACHLAGMAFGVWWAMKGEQWWDRRSRSGAIGGGRSTATFAGFGGQAPKPARVGFAKKLVQRQADEETIDRILRKVYDGGIHSLSESEKRALQEATDRQQQREREAGRIDRL